MKQPTCNMSDHPCEEWYRYYDAICDTAHDGHGLDVWWDAAIVYVHTTENPAGDTLGFHRCQPRWVATWTIADDHDTAQPADADARLLCVADGPAIDADSHDIGAWISLVVTTIAGHRPDGFSTRDFTAAGYTTLPNPR